MDNSNKSKLFTFGKLENNEDSDSEDSPYDSADDDSILENKASENSSETITNHQWLAKEMGKLNSTGRPTSSYTSSSSSYDFYKRRNHNGSSTDTIEPRPRHEIYTERQNPFVIDQRQKDRSLPRDDYLKLPSEVTDKEYIYMPPSSEDIDDEKDMNVSGKWMVFPEGNLHKLDQYWLALIPLYKNGTLARIKCSTAMGSEAGVINCYTADSENVEEVKSAADAIRECINYDTLMYYKTNEASALGLYLRFGSKSISKYMHTINNCLYVKHKFDRWKLVSL